MGAEQREPVWLVIIAALVVAVVAMWLWRPAAGPARSADVSEPARADAISVPGPTDLADVVTADAGPDPVDATPDALPPPDATPRDADRWDFRDIVEHDEPSLTLRLQAPTARVGETVVAVVEGRGLVGEIDLRLPDGVSVAQSQSAYAISIDSQVITRRRTLTLDIVADEAGRYTIGPAVAPLADGGQVESGVASLRVR